MTEREQDALPVVEQDELELPIPGSSGGSPDAGSAPVGLDAKAIASRLDKFEETLRKLPDLIDSGIKSTKDKRFAALEGVDPDTLRRFKSYLEKAGGDENVAIREMKVDDLINGRTSQQPDLGRSGDVEKRMTRYVRRLLSSAGISFKDPEYAAIVAKHSRGALDEEAFYDDVDVLVEKAHAKTGKQEGVSASAVVMEGGNIAPPTGDLTEKYKSEMLAARGRGMDVGREIKRKYRQLGVDVDAVEFGRYPGLERNPREESSARIPK